MSGNETSSAAYKPLPQVPPSQALLAEEGADDIQDVLDLQDRYKRQNLAYRSHSPVPTSYRDDAKGGATHLESLEMASYAQDVTYGGGAVDREPELVGSTPVKEERKGDKTALYVTLVSVVYMRSFRFVFFVNSVWCRRS